MIVERDYAPETGRAESLCAGTSGSQGCAIFDAGYGWDANGNLITLAFFTGSRYAVARNHRTPRSSRQCRILKIPPKIFPSSLPVAFPARSYPVLDECEHRVLEIRT